MEKTLSEEQFGRAEDALSALIRQKAPTAKIAVSEWEGGAVLAGPHARAAAGSACGNR